MKTSVQVMSIGAMLAALTAQGESLTREQIDAMLLKIAQTQPSKTSYSPGATCYEMMAPERDEYEYVCKKCGTHTFHAKMSGAAKRAMESCEKAAEEFRGKGLAIELDSTVLCEKCHPEEVRKYSPPSNPDAEPWNLEEPGFYWITKVGEKASRVVVKDIDVALLRAFLDKEEPVSGGWMGDRPIQMFMDRLCTLLGADNADALKEQVKKLDLTAPRQAW